MTTRFYENAHNPWRGAATERIPSATPHPIFIPMKLTPMFFVFTLVGIPLIHAAPSVVVPPAALRVTLQAADVQTAPTPDRVHLGGWIGQRVLGNEANRLAQIDTNRLLEGYRQRPGRQTWDCEHVGKWLHAASLAWANTGDPALRKKLGETVAGLCACQLEDGYLGTYLEKDRWSEWDVWAHKYNLIGLLTYMRYTGDTTPLPICVKMADLLCRSFGDEGGKRDIVKFGHHNGMAATSVLEPMVQLYEVTGEPRYLEFCRYIVRAWEQPDGPHVISRLLELKRVDKVGNAKAYEMLSCLNGALELYRVTGERTLLEACLNAWQDIVQHRLYITGTTSYAEYFHEDYDLPNRGNVAETCVTVTWMQLNARLLQLTGEARFAEQIERTVMNQLFGAQQPDCKAWGYYVEMEGRKPYSATLDANCCLSSGPRGVALIPTFAAGVDADGVVVNLYTQTEAELNLADGTPVALSIETDYPKSGRVALRLRPAASKEFSVKLRLPEWSSGAAATVNGEPVALASGRDGYAAVRRVWKTGDVLDLTVPVSPRVIVGDHLNAGKVAFAYGPLILAADASLIGSAGSLASIAIADTAVARVQLTPVHGAAGEPLKYELDALSRDVEHPTKKATPVKIRLVPFADAGGSGANYRIWLPVFGVPGFNLASLGTESVSRSRPNTWGNPISIIDGNVAMAVTTETGTAADEDWFAVTLPAPTTIARAVYYHGRSAENGGWFDASKSRPQIQVQRETGGAWQTVGELTGYPATTATSSRNLKPGSRFEVPFPKPVTAVALRVIGRPAGGQLPAEAHASCSELELYAD